MGKKIKLPENPPELGFDSNDKELVRLRYQTWLELVKASYTADLAAEQAERAMIAAIDQEREKAAWANEYTLAQAVHSAYLEVAKQEADRVTDRADFVQKVAAAISGIYIATLGLSYGLGDKNTPLPLQGMAVTFFLGLAIFLATAYAGFITKPEDIEGPTGGDFYTIQNQRLSTFILWARAASVHRRHLLQSAIISLGIGVLFLPVPYLNLRIEAVGIMVLIGLLIALIPFFGPIRSSRAKMPAGLVSG